MRHLGRDKRVFILSLINTSVTAAEDTVANVWNIEGKKVDDYILVYDCLNRFIYLKREWVMQIFFFTR